MFGLGLGYSVLLVLCILCVCAFEFINGFHDTANAVATVIYTKSLKPLRIPDNMTARHGLSDLV